MNRISGSLLACVGLVLIGGQVSSQANVKIGNTMVMIDTVIKGLNVPWEIIYGPDEHLWVTEREGIVSRINPVTGLKTEVLDVKSSVYAQAEAGLLGMALLPGKEVTDVFIVHTYSYGVGPIVKEKLVKYTFDTTNKKLVNPVVLLDGIEGGTAHNGSRLMFLPDHTLLMTTGDSQYGPRAQDLNSLNGKVLRIKTDGSVPSDNPVTGKYIYTLGHRNCQGLCRAPNGRVYVSEHGPDSDDEFQELVPGRNYGWPNVKGFCEEPSELSFCSAVNVKEPLLHWTPTIAPASIMYYNNDSFPEFDDRFLMTNLKTKKIVAIKLDAAGTASVSEASYLQNMFGRLRCITSGPHSEIYIGTNGPESYNTEPNTHSIIRLTPPINILGMTERSAGIIARCVPTCFTDRLTVETNAKGNRQTIEVTNLTGELVAKAIAEPEVTIDASAWPTGLYIVRLLNSGRTLWCQKVVKVPQP